MTTPLRRRVLTDGRIIEMWKGSANWRVTITLPLNDGASPCSEWVFELANLSDALNAALTWDGIGDPAGGRAVSL